MKKKIIATIHFNTPELTECMIRSLRKQSAEAWRVIVFDNSDTRPFRPMDGVEILDNTAGQLIDLDAEIARYEGRNRRVGGWYENNFGSDRHIMSVDRLMQILGEPFILCDSDILFKSDPAALWHPEATAAGQVEKAWGNPQARERLLPLLCFINTPECQRMGIRYHDPLRSFALGAGLDWYDTGASFLEDVRETDGATFLPLTIDDKMVHLGSGSWKRKQLQVQGAWLRQWEHLWNPDVDTPTPYYSIIDDKNNPVNITIMNHIQAITHNGGRQYRLNAEEGFLLRSKSTGKTFRSIDTTRLNNWEAIEDPEATEKAPKKTTKGGKAKK